MHNTAPVTNVASRGRTLRLAFISAVVSLVAAFAVVGSAIPLFIAGKRPGRPPKHSRRRLIDGIRCRARTGSPWRDVPPGYGPWQSVYGLFRRWQRDGTGGGCWARSRPWRTLPAT